MHFLLNVPHFKSLTGHKELLPLGVLHNRAARRRVGHRERLDAVATLAARDLDCGRWQH